jgi:predicted RNA methylase
MSFLQRFEKSIVIRLVISAGLACIALLLFIISNRTLTTSDGHDEALPATTKAEVSSAVANTIDVEVDSVLVRFNIERTWIRKKSVPVINSAVNRIERHIMIPPDIIPVQMNHALNIMAQRFNGKAIASENLKENSVTIHIEMQGYIIQTLVLKPNASLRRTENSSKPTRA